MRRSLRARVILVLALTGIAATAGLAGAQTAFGFAEQYGFVAVVNNGYVQSAGAHTFVINDGAGEGGQLACQLFNNKGANEVNHGSGVCAVFYGGGEFVWARVYNQSGHTEVVGGEAET